MKALKEAKAGKADVAAAVAELQAAKEVVTALEQRLKLKPGLPRKEGGEIDYAADFFARQAFLTVSGQLQVRGLAGRVGFRPWDLSPKLWTVKSTLSGTRAFH